MKRKIEMMIAAVCPLVVATACCQISAGWIGDRDYWGNQDGKMVVSQWSGSEMF